LDIIAIDYSASKKSIALLTKKGEIYKFGFEEGQATNPERGV